MGWGLFPPLPVKGGQGVAISDGMYYKEGLLMAFAISSPACMDRAAGLCSTTHNAAAMPRKCVTPTLPPCPTPVINTPRHLAPCFHNTCTLKDAVHAPTPPLTFSMYVYLYLCLCVGLFLVGIPTVYPLSSRCFRPCLRLNGCPWTHRASGPRPSSTPSTPFSSRRSSSRGTWRKTTHTQQQQWQ